jgi:hypothetical protein
MHATRLRPVSLVAPTRQGSGWESGGPGNYSEQGNRGHDRVDCRRGFDTFEADFEEPVRPNCEGQSPVSGETLREFVNVHVRNAFRNGGQTPSP